MASDPLEDLIAGLGSGFEAPSWETKRILLELARHVAHSGERKNAPLATYMAGLYVASSDASDEEAVAEVLDVAKRTIEEIDGSG